MRLGRILLASLTALAACSYAQAAPDVRTQQSFPRLLQAVMPLLAAAADASAPAPAVKPAPAAVLSLGALAETALAGSLVLVASSAAVDFRPRRHQRTFLRC